MSDWPPKASKSSDDKGQSPLSISQSWQILEKAVLASVEEQRRTRRWGIFFKAVSFIFFLIIILLMSKSCQTDSDNPEGATVPHLAVVDIEGTIASDSKSVNSDDTNRAIDRAFKAKNSQAVVLNINSPGGSPVQSDQIWQEIRYQKQQYPNKKVYAVIGDMGASGAYYIASAADEIYVNPSSIVGSIGVIMPNYGVSELAKKLGIEDRTITSGEHKAILSWTKPVNPEEKAHVQALLDDVHQHFIDAVKAGRGARLKTENKDLFSGLFWTGDQAIKLGLADKIGSIQTLSRQLHVDKTVDYTVTRNPLEQVFGKLGASVGQGIGQSMTKQLETETQRVTMQ